jgi:hypothetical protein
MMTWRIHFYYLVAITILGFLITQSNMVFGGLFTFAHVWISIRFLEKLHNGSFSRKDIILSILLGVFGILVCFAAIYCQHGVVCEPQNTLVKNFWMCLKVSAGNFIGHLPIDCQADGIYLNVAILEPIVGAIYLIISGLVLPIVLRKSPKDTAIS